MEKSMSINKLVVGFCFLIVFANALAAQNQTPDTPKKTVQHVAIKSTSAASGKEMYTSYCAVCHGTDGKGGGPAASALKTAPVDLTILSKNNGGKFPALKVASVLQGTAALPAHGSQEMPMWGPLFRIVSGGREAELRLRISNVTGYVESLQAK
jgi:mono/diheme cytochrome c family protein